MPQLFRCNDRSIEFDDYLSRLKNFQAVNAYNYLDTISTSLYMGYWIYDNDLFDIAKYFSRDFFATNFNAIVNAFKVAGTYQSYIAIIQSAVGGDTEINFSSPAPSHLVINVSNPTGARTWGAITPAGNPELTEVMPDQINYPDSVFGFQSSIAALTVPETVALLEMLNVNGVFVEIFFS
jgi:hypothetical protein